MKFPERPSSILDKIGVPEGEAEDEENTVSFLDRFLNEKSANGTAEHVEEVVAETSVIEEEIVEEPVAEAVEEVVEEIEEIVPEISAAKEEPQAEEAAPSIEEEPADSKWEKPETPPPAPSSSILDKLQERSQTIADKFVSKSAAPSVGSVNGNRKIQLDEIPIHKQYQYVQKVFEGNNVRFRVIVEKVNNAANKDEVEELLHKYILGNKDLNQDDQVVSEFIELLRNRF